MEKSSKNIACFFIVIALISLTLLLCYIIQTDDLYLVLKKEPGMYCGLRDINQRCLLFYLKLNC